MTDDQKRMIAQMIQSGLNHREIAESLNLKTNTIKTYCWRQGLHPIKKPKPPVELNQPKKKPGRPPKLKPAPKPRPFYEFCLTCNKPLVQGKLGRGKKFCSKKCGTDWWNSHPKMITGICVYCGKSFTTKNHKQRYCSKKCFMQCFSEERARKAEIRSEEMQEKQMHEVYGTQNSFYFMLDAAMRYALGRKSYDVGLVAGFIKDNLSVFNEKWLVNIINDIKWYLDDRENGKIDDDDCDHQLWLNLREAVREEYRSRNFSKPSRYNMVDRAWLEE